MVLGEIPGAFTSYWTKRFPLLLVHSWLTMQCVALETTFQHYYHKTYRYSYQNFLQQIEDYIMEIPKPFPSCYDNGGSPKRVQKSKLNNDRRDSFGVGLYRNIPRSGDVDVNEVNVTVTDNFKFNRKNNESTVRIRSKNNKRASKRDEPLVWAIHDK